MGCSCFGTQFLHSTQGSPGQYRGVPWTGSPLHRCHPAAQSTSSCQGCNRDVPVALPQPWGCTHSTGSQPPSSCWALGETLPLQVIFPPAHFAFPVGNWDSHGYWPCCRDLSLAAQSPSAEPCPSTSREEELWAQPCQILLSFLMPNPLCLALPKPHCPHRFPSHLTPSHIPQNCLPRVLLLNPSVCISPPQTHS